MPIPDLSATVLSFADPITVTRRPRATYTDGSPVVGDPTTLTVLGTWESATGRDLQRVPEGLRTEEGVVIYSAAQLQTAGASNEPDLVTIEGESYQVGKVERWHGYWRATASKVGVQ